ncbi:hypothetical protein UlMin_016426 [Ulmus minor]
MLLKEVFHLNPNEMMFKVHETLLKFSISDFAIIIGLNCAEYPSFCNEDGIPKQLPFGSSWLCSKYFPGKSSIYRGDLYDFLDQNQVKDDTDAIKLVLIFIVDYILLSKKDNKLVDKYLWHMVDSLDMFGSFPWGRKSFFLTLEYLKKALKGKQSDSQQDVIYYKLFGFPTAFQIWIYECFISLPKTVISYHGPKIPRICSWSKAFKSNFFSLNEKALPVRNLVPTERECKDLLSCIPEFTGVSSVHKKRPFSEEELKSDSVQLNVSADLYHFLEPFFFSFFLFKP